MSAPDRDWNLPTVSPKRAETCGAGLQACPARVSVVIPCRNEARHIVSLLDAVRMQDTLVDEVIVVDCGSTDSTLELINHYARQHPGLALRLVFCSEASIPKAVNTGVSAATGEIIVRLDAHVRPASNYVRVCLGGVPGAVFA